MFDNIKNLIKSKRFELKDMLNKINIVWLESMITDEQMKELKELARQNAIAENSYAPLQEQINNIYSEMEAMKAEIKKLKGETGEVTEPEEPVETEEYPAFVQPTGAHDAYKIGDKITYNGKKYICKLDGCVWAPDIYPAGWQEVVERDVEENTDETDETENNVEETVANEEG